MRPDASGTSHFFFENKQFLTKIGELEAHFIFDNGQFLAQNCEIAAHCLFENGAILISSNIFACLQFYSFIYLFCKLWS